MVRAWLPAVITAAILGAAFFLGHFQEAWNVSWIICIGIAAALELMSLAERTLQHRDELDELTRRLDALEAHQKVLSDIAFDRERS